VLTAKEDQFLLFRIFIYCIAVWKILELSSKTAYVYRYASFHSLTSSFQIAILAAILANAQFIVLTIFLATLLGAPIISVMGTTFFLPSYSRPAAFWEEPLTFEPKPGDSLFYKVISDSLGDVFQSLYASGKLVDIGANTFYLICDDYFNAIIHIVAAGSNYLALQLRGLESREQTLCHQHELNFLRRNLEEFQETRIYTFSSTLVRFTDVIWQLLDKVLHYCQFPPVLGLKSRAFIRSATWKTLYDDFAVNSYSVSSNNLNGVFPDNHHKSLLGDSLMKVLTVIIDDTDRVGQPENIEFQFDQEFDQAALDWMEVHEKRHIASQLFCLCHVLLQLRASIADDFEWKVYSMFTGPSLSLAEFQWIPVTINKKLISGFRIALALAVHTVFGDMGDEVEEIQGFIRDQYRRPKFIPADDPNWKEMVCEHVDELETFRRITDGTGLIIKYMHFKYGSQTFKLMKLNDEEVLRAWAGQIFEMLYFETEDKERTSIQFDHFTLRNMISQSANLPIGYPETICLMTLSFSDIF
jgi:hypothetical protein